MITPEQAKEFFENNKYVEGIGRRKSSTARVRITKGKGVIAINNRSFDEYFKNLLQKKRIYDVIESIPEKINISVHVKGGGLTGHSDAIVLGIARAYVQVNPDIKKDFKTKSFLTRDVRRVERKKPGLRKARKAPQWSKR